MRRIDRYVLAHLLWPALLALALVTFLGVAQELREYFRELPSALLTPWDVIRLVVFLSPLLFPIVAPIAYFFGVLIGCSRLAEDGEITAIKAAGISMRRLSVPIIAVGLLLSCIAFLIQDQLQPRAIRYAYNVMFEEMPNRLTLDALPPGEMHNFEGWRVFIGERDSESGALLNVEIIEPGTEGKPPRIFHADSAQVETHDGTTTLTLFNGYVLPEDQSFVFFPKMTQRIPHQIEHVPSTKLQQFASTTAQLFRREKELSAELDREESLVVRGELHIVRSELGNRLSFPFAALGVALVGAGTALRVRKAAKPWAFAIGFSVLVLYFVIISAVEPKELRPLGEVIGRFWIPNALLYLFGLVQWLRVDRI